MRLPDFFDATKLKPINFYGYRSSVTDRFYELDVHSTEAQEEYAEEIRRFHELKLKCMDTELDVSPKAENPNMQKDIWDNKVVIECETERGGIVFVGYYDCNYVIGLGRDGDNWVKPMPYGRKQVFEKASS